MYVSSKVYGIKIFDIKKDGSLTINKELQNIGVDITEPFSAFGSTVNYRSKDSLKVFYLTDSFVDGTSIGTYAIEEEGSVKEGKSGCFIATAAYGSYFEPHVETLRIFRDKYLLTNTLGRQFVSFYYQNSPAFADKIATSDTARATIRVVLTPIVYIIKYPLNTILILLIIIFLYRNREIKIKNQIH